MHFLNSRTQLTLATLTHSFGTVRRSAMPAMTVGQTRCNLCRLFTEKKGLPQVMLRGYKPSHDLCNFALSAQIQPPGGCYLDAFMTGDGLPGASSGRVFSRNRENAKLCHSEVSQEKPALGVFSRLWTCLSRFCMSSRERGASQSSLRSGTRRSAPVAPKTAPKKSYLAIRV